MSSSGFPSNTETSEIAGRSQPEHDQSEGGRTALSKLADRVIADCPDGIFTHDLEFRLILWNPAMERLSGIRKEQALGKGAFHVFPFLKGDGADKADGGKLNGEAVVYDEVSFAVPQTGQRGVYQCQYSPLRNEQGEIVGGLGIVHDVSKHKRAEEALHATAQRLKYLLASTSVAIYTARTSGHYGPTSITENVREMLGYEPEELIADSSFWIDHVHPEDRRRILTELPRLERGVCTYEYRFQHKDGTYRWMRDEMRLITDALGNPAEIVGYWIDITERKVKEEGYQNIIHTTRDGFWIVDTQGRFLDVNDAYCVLTGYSREELLNMSIQDVAAVETPREISQRIQQVIRASHARFETRHRCKNGRIVDIEINTTYAGVRDDRLFVFARDITERKRAEEALAESEERYRSLVEAAPDVIYTVSAEDGSLTSLNPAFETLTGWSRTEWLGKPIVGIVHPDDLPVAVETLQKASRGETQPPYELRVLSKSGEYLVGEFTSTPHVKDGKVVGELGIARDITARKRTEEALRESEERFRSLVENATVGIYRTTPDGRILMANPALVRMLGYESFQALATRDLEQEGFEPTYPRSAFRERIEREGEVTGLEAAWKRRDGSTIYVRESAHAVRASDGRVLYYDGIVEDVTERKRAEEQLRYQAALLASVNDAIVASDVQYRLTAWNKAAESVYGWKAEEVLGRNGLEIMRTEWFGVDADRMRRTIAETGRWRGEVTQTRKDGTRIPVELSSIVLRDESGQITGYVSVNRDITERKRAEEALRQSKESFEALAENASDAILIGTGEEGRHVYANRRAVEITGYPIEDLLKTRIRDLAHPDELRKLAERYKKRLEGSKVPKPYETALLNKDGIEVPIEISPSKTIWQNQLADMVIFRDITERKRAEEALQESQEMFQKAFQASPDTMVLHSLSEGRYMDVNESFLRLVGYRREDLVGRTAMDLGLWWDLAQGNEYLRVLREQGRVRDLEICVRTKSGEARTLLLSAEVIEIAGQDCVVAIGKDISEQKKAEQERPRLEEQLRQAQKMEAVGRLAGGVAHDFNNILMVINGYVQLVLRKLSPRHPLRQNLNEIRKAGERAASLTGQLLAFSRRQILVPRILDLNKVVADTKEMLRRVIGEDVELVVRQGCKLAEVLADPGQITQVLVNLAVNARDAMPGGGRLTIETGNVDLRGAETGDLPGAAPGPYVMLAVSDTGVGMSREVMEHMFEPFFTTRERGKGTGLGLSTVYGIVKQSGGYVRVQSEPGQGSAFRIYLPCARVGSGKPAARSTKARLARGRETVLVVEDELAVRQVVAATLRSCGYKVLEAGSGEEAMRRLRRHEGPLHLALCDLVMPRMNGRKVADSVRTLYPEVKVVFMSGYTDDALLRHGVSDAQGSFLPKPFTIEALTQKVRDVLNPSQ